MTGADFSAFLDRMGWSQRQASIELELSRNTVAKYSEQGAPRLVGLACAAIAAGLAEWGADG